MTVGPPLTSLRGGLDMMHKEGIKDGPSRALTLEQAPASLLYLALIGFFGVGRVEIDSRRRRERRSRVYCFRSLENENTRG